MEKTKIEQAKEIATTLSEKLEDPEEIKAIADLCNLLQGVDEEQGKLIEKHSQLVKDYRAAIMNAALPPKHTAEETGSTGPVSFDSFLSDKLKGK